MNVKNPDKILISTIDIHVKITELAEKINADYAGKHPVIVCILKGAFYFTADLTRQLSIPINLDFISIGIDSEEPPRPGMVKIMKDLDIDIKGRHVLLVEDIIGTGLTLGYIVQHLESKKPESLKICTLLTDPSSRLISMPIDYTGFTAPKCKMVGYGLDCEEEFRHLPYIAEYEEK